MFSSIDFPLFSSCKLCRKGKGFQYMIGVDHFQNIYSQKMINSAKNMKHVQLQRFPSVFLIQVMQKGKRFSIHLAIRSYCPLHLLGHNLYPVIFVLWAKTHFFLIYIVNPYCPTGLFKGILSFRGLKVSIRSENVFIHNMSAGNHENRMSTLQQKIKNFQIEENTATFTF